MLPADPLVIKSTDKPDRAGPQQSHRLSPSGGDEWDRKVVKRTLSLYERDAELLDWITAHLGCSQSEAFRTAIRIAAGQLAQVAASK